MSCIMTRSKPPDESASRTHCPVRVFSFENSANRAPPRVMATTSVSKMDASVWGMLLAEVRLLPTMSIERIESLPCEGCIKPVNPFIVAVVIRANELPRAEAARLVLQGRGAPDLL
mgnify:FL=1